MKSGGLCFVGKDLLQYKSSINDLFVYNWFGCFVFVQVSRSLLVECIKHIYLYIVKNGQRQDLNTASKFLKVSLRTYGKSLHGTQY